MNHLGTLVGLLPAGRLKNRLMSMTGHAVHPTARVHPVLLLGATRMEVGRGARIGSLNVFRSVTRAVVANDAEIGPLNWFVAGPFLVSESSSEIAGMLLLDEHSSVTNRHYFDVSGGVHVGAFTTVAGVRSSFLTHGIDVTDNVMDTAPIVLGDHSMVGSNCKLVLGATVPARSVVAMGSVVVPGLKEPDSLYAGAPAVRKKAVDIGRYGSRVSGAVPVRRGH